MILHIRLAQAFEGEGQAGAVTHPGRGVKCVNLLGRQSYSISKKFK